MRELTKSMLSFSWALPLFGMKQMMDMAAPRDPSRPFGRVTESFDAVTRTAQDQLGGAWTGAFRAGDRLQRGMVDLMFSLFSPDGWSPARVMRSTSEVMQSSMATAGQVAGAAAGAARDPWPVDERPAAAPPPVESWSPAPASIPSPSAEPGSPPGFGPPPGWTVSTPRL
jgi:hypothetical protein